MAFNDLLNKLDNMAQSKRKSQPSSSPETQRLVNLQNEVSKKLGVTLTGTPKSEDEIVQKASQVIRDRNPKSIGDALPDLPKFQSLTPDNTSTKRSALETAIRLPALAAQEVLHNVSLGAIPKKLTPAETGMERFF